MGGRIELRGRIEKLKEIVRADLSFLFVNQKASL